jgi:uncharacterized membrane protein (UPF0127 family)
VGEARTFLSRLLGLMGKKKIQGSALWFPRCQSIHTCFMRIPIDVAFLDREGRVVERREALRAWRLVSGGSAADSALELPAGALAELRIELGDLIEW